EVAGEGAQAAVGGGADGAGSFAEDLGRGGGVEAEDGAQQHGLGLVGRQAGDQADGGVGGDRVQGGGGGVVAGGQAGQVSGGYRDGGGGAGGAAQVVEGAVAGDGGAPPAEPVAVAVEAGQVAGDLQPGLGGDVLGVVADQGAQVAQQPGLGVAVQRPERVGVPPLRLGHHRGQVHHVAAANQERRRRGLRPVGRTAGLKGAAGHQGSAAGARDWRAGGPAWPPPPRVCAAGASAGPARQRGGQPRPAAAARAETG